MHTIPDHTASANSHILEAESQDAQNGVFYIIVLYPVTDDFYLMCIRMSVSSVTSRRFFVPNFGYQERWI